MRKPGTLRKIYIYKIYFGKYTQNLKAVGNTFQKICDIRWSTNALSWSRDTDRVEIWVWPIEYKTLKFKSILFYRSGLFFWSRGREGRFLIGFGWLHLLVLIILPHLQCLYYCITLSWLSNRSMLQQTLGNLVSISYHSHFILISCKVISLFNLIFVNFDKSLNIILDKFHQKWMSISIFYKKKQVDILDVNNFLDI